MSTKGKKAPYRKIVGYNDVDSIEMGYRMKMRFDVMECGHESGAVFLPKPSRTPYRHQPDGTVLRRCLKCPRESAA